jgi:predicted GIY-YIG superfamily endonuclease
MSYIYLIKTKNEGKYKIGVTKDIQQRLKTLQTGSSDELILIDKYYSDYAFQIERALHNFYKPNNILNEWFELYIEDEVNFNKKCLQIENNLIYLKKNKI